MTALRSPVRWLDAEFPHNRDRLHDARRQVWRQDFQNATGARQERSAARTITTTCSATDNMKHGGCTAEVSPLACQPILFLGSHHYANRSEERRVGKECRSR